MPLSHSGGQLLSQFRRLSAASDHFMALPLRSIIHGGKSEWKGTSKEDQDGDDISPFSIGDKNETSHVDGGHKRQSTRTRIPRGQFPNFARGACISIGAVDATPPVRQLAAPAHSRYTHSHTDQRSPRADKSSGRERSEGESHAGNAKYLLSSLLLLSSFLIGCCRQRECLREYGRGVGCGMSARERGRAEEDVHDGQTEKRREQRIAEQSHLARRSVRAQQSNIAAKALIMSPDSAIPPPPSLSHSSLGM